MITHSLRRSSHPGESRKPGMLGPRGSMEADDSHRFGTSPRYARAGIPPQREARDHGSDVITLVSKERVEREKQPGTINWIVWLMVAAIGIFLAFVMSTVFTGIFFALSLAPPLILIYAVYWWSERPKLAPVLFWGVFWSGLVSAVILALTVGLFTTWLISLMSMGGTTTGINAGQAVLFAFIVAGLLEETTKYLVVRAVENHAKLSYEQSVINQKIIRERAQLPPLTARESQIAAESHPGPRLIRHPYGMVLVGMAVGLGFATLENILFGVVAARNLAWVIPIFRAALAVPAHMMWGGLIGERIARKIWFGEDQNYFTVCWLPILLHGLYDFFLLFFGVFAIERPGDEVGFAVGALVGSFLVFCATILALALRVKALFDDSENLPAIEYRPKELLPSNLRDDIDVRVEDPDRAPDADLGQEKRGSGSGQPSSSAYTESTHQDTTSSSSGAAGTTQSSSYVPSAVPPHESSSTTDDITERGGTPPTHTSAHWYQGAPQQTGLKGASETDKGGLRSGMIEQQQRLEQQQQQRQLEEAAERRRRQILTQQLQPNYG